jgi:hypothetical protein
MSITGTLQKVDSRAGHHHDSLVNATTDTAVGKGSAPNYQLKVVLIGSEPPIWRRLQVPGNAKLDWLHAALQVALGWTNSHLHQYRAGKDLYAAPDDDFFVDPSGPETHEETAFTLQQIAPHENDTFIYEYDFGDCWEHQVTVEKILPPAAGLAKTAFCLDGARACPPEDCGGIWGYAELLKALKDRKHPEHKSMKEWLGGTHNAEAFDVEKTNRWLKKLKWPGVTEDQLRKILMGRDGYHE